MLPFNKSPSFPTIFRFGLPSGMKEHILVVRKLNLITRIFAWQY